MSPIYNFNKRFYMIAKKSTPCFYVYILECLDGTYYTGYTGDLPTRIIQHKNNLGAKYTKSKGFKKLVYFESHLTKGSAMKREIAIKKAGRVYKGMLVTEFQKNMLLFKE